MIGSIVVGYILLGTGVFLGLIANDDYFSHKKSIRQHLTGWAIVTSLWLALLLIILWACYLDTSQKPEKK